MGFLVFILLGIAASATYALSNVNENLANQGTVTLIGLGLLALVLLRDRRH